MATKVWFTSAAHPTGKGSTPRQILVRSSHRSARSNSAIKGPWTIGDISVFGFTLSLVLLGTILSAYTDRPVFWLLVGPGPIAIGFTLITFLRQGFGRRHELPVVEKRGRSGGHSNPAPRSQRLQSRTRPTRDHSRFAPRQRNRLTHPNLCVTSEKKCAALTASPKYRPGEIRRGI
jgi:hypothetical protein